MRLIVETSSTPEGVTYINLEDRTPTKMTEEEIDQHMLCVIFQQHCFKAGLTIFGKEGNKAVNKELQQNHNMTTLAPIYGTKLSRQERTNALVVLMFLSQKRDGKVKARKCADGRKKYSTITKVEATSPTFSQEAIFMITAATEDLEAHHMSVIDLPGAFLHAETDEMIIVI